MSGQAQLTIVVTVNIYLTVKGLPHTELLGF